MSPGGGRRAGERIAAARKLRRLTQAQLAEAAAISVSLLRKIEQGSRPVTPAVWSSVSRALGLQGAVSAGGRQSAHSRVRVAIPNLRCALDCYDLPDDGPVAPLPDLRAATEKATARRLAAQYASLADTLPALVTELTRAAHSYAGHDQEITFGLLTLAYRAADAICDKFGYPDLSARTIGLMRWAAARSGDPVLAGVAAYVRAEMFFSNGRQATGLRALDAASRPLAAHGSREALAVYGSLYMRAGVLAARAGLPETAASYLAEARDIGRHVPDATYRGTAFGPSSVQIHEMPAAAELGDSMAALRRTASWQPPLTVPAERRSHYFIELARTQVWAGRHNEALASLNAARHAAPQHTRHNPHVHETARTLLRQHRHPGDTLIGFAHWIGLDE
ncbi:MAG TPA: helix-turn-helix transcriptional regulator [Streptosporangiaceae bacterium]|nr:helix-turn-helix transcriptional regulator [Streptosporangiaceae bacterium]